MEKSKWQTLLAQAAESLHRACETAAESIARGEAGVKDIRELTAALKELSALSRSLSSGAEAAEGAAVEVSFDDEGEGWSR